MGNYSLVVVLGAVLAGTSLMMITSTATLEADQQVNQHTFKTIAREAALTGLNMTARKLVADSVSWYEDPDQYAYANADWKYSTFSTRVETLYTRGPVLDRCAIDTVDVVSVGRSLGGVDHMTKATYVRTCSNEGLPPGFRFATVSDLDFDIDGEIRVWSADASRNANVHSNGVLTVTDKAFVEGFGSQTSPSGGGCPSDSDCDNAVTNPFGSGDLPIFYPNDDVNGSADDFLRGEPIVEIPSLVAAEWLPRATHVASGDVRINGNTTYDFRSYDGITGYGTAENPALWYIAGDLEVNADLFQIIGHVMIVVEGGVKVDGDAKFVTGVDAGESPPATNYDNPNVDDVRSWMATHLPDGSTMGLYAAGCYDGQCSNSGIHLNGNAVVVGQLFANNDISINGDATVFGAIATRGSMHYNGKNVLWYTGASETVVLPGMLVNLPDGVRLLTQVEW